MNNLAILLKDMKNYKQAQKFFRDALEFRQKNLSPNHEDIGSSMNNLASILNDMKNY